MTLNKLAALAACLTLVLSCTSTVAQQQAEPPATVAGPASAAEISKRLAVRHIEDLPDAEGLAKYANAEAALVFIADNDDKMVVRVRALTLLRHYPSPRTLSFLSERAVGADLHPTVKAGAMRGLEGHNDVSTVVALLTKGMRDKDVRVAIAAARSLAADPQHAAALKAAGEDPEVSEQLREKIKKGEL